MAYQMVFSILVTMPLGRCDEMITNTCFYCLTTIRLIGRLWDLIGDFVLLVPSFSRQGADTMSQESRQSFSLCKAKRRPEAMANSIAKVTWCLPIDVNCFIISQSQLYEDDFISVQSSRRGPVSFGKECILLLTIYFSLQRHNNNGRGHNVGPRLLQAVPIGEALF